MEKSLWNSQLGGGSASGDFVINKTPDSKIELAYTEGKLKAYVDGQVMDFSVRQLDSLQKRLVYSINGKSSYGEYSIEGSYICEADGLYEPYISFSDYANNHTVSVYALYNGSTVLTVSNHFVTDNTGWDDGDCRYDGGSGSEKIYANKGDIIRITSYGYIRCYGNLIGQIYFTPYK